MPAGDVMRPYFLIDLMLLLSLGAAIAVIVTALWLTRPIDWSACAVRGTDHSIPAGCR